jgi:hypothetical protein
VSLRFENDGYSPHKLNVQHSQSGRVACPHRRQLKDLESPRGSGLLWKLVVSGWTLFVVFRVVRVVRGSSLLKPRNTRTTLNTTKRSLSWRLCCLPPRGRPRVALRDPRMPLSLASFIGGPLMLLVNPLRSRAPSSGAPGPADLVILPLLKEGSRYSQKFVQVYSRPK